MLTDFQCQIIIYRESVSEGPIRKKERNKQNALTAYRKKFIIIILKCMQPKGWIIL
jgi:hypothetical protein